MEPAARQLSLSESLELAVGNVYYLPAKAQRCLTPSGRHGWELGCDMDTREVAGRNC